MEVFENSENKWSDINLEDFPFICRICLRRGDLRLFVEEDYLLDLFVKITKIDVHSTVNFPSNICNECISKLEDISLFIDTSKYNYTSQEKNLIPKKENENVAIGNCGSSQQCVVKTEKTDEEYIEDIYIEESEICRICSLASFVLPLEEKEHLMQLFQKITDIDVKTEANSSKRNSICNKCINELEKISFFISFSWCTNMKLENTIGRNEALRTEGYLEEVASASDIDSSKCNDIKFKSSSGTNRVKMETYSDENIFFYESKDFHTVVDIKEDFHSPEVSVIENYQNDLEFCSEKPSGGDPCKNEFSTENLLNIIPTGLEFNLEAQFLTEKFTCDSCEKSFSTRTKLKNHLLTHTEKPLKCGFCEKAVSSKAHLQEHMRTHTGEKPFKCDFCEKSFAFRNNLKRHAFSHTGEKPLKCDLCEKRFKRGSALKYHSLTHTGEKTFKCDICEKRFSRKSNLQDHMRTHSGEKTFKCDFCEKSFARSNNLKRHAFSHTGEKSHKCDFCEKSFAFGNTLKKHLLVHAEKNTLKCDICGKSFSKKSHFQGHMRTHTGEKPFKCDFCEKSFAFGNILKKHLLTHTGEKPFKCDICGKRVASKWHLQRHMHTHTG